MASFAYHLVICLVPLSCLACDAGQAPQQPQPAVATPPQAEAPKLVQPEPVPPAVKTVPRAAPAGWTHISMQDAVPFCLFHSYREFGGVEFAKEAHQQQLPADAEVVVGFFPGWCVSEACDDAPSLQCNVERNGQVLELHARYWGDRKQDSQCKPSTCRPITAACALPKLESGTYTLLYGNREYALTIPSTLADPCFNSRDDFGLPSAAFIGTPSASPPATKVDSRQSGTHGKAP